jgi:hypothetical protein
MSLQLTATQMLPLQTPVAQSAATLQPPPVGQVLPAATQVVPPQSTSVSVPFLTVSLHDAVVHLPALHRLLAQSVFKVQFLAAAQRAQVVEPPQSVSDSPPLVWPSAQLAVWHTLPVHTLLVQSEATPHALVGPHLVQVPPPQSMSVSAPFLKESLQVGAAQAPPVHTPL